MILEEKYDPLKLYFGDDYKITPEITIHQPTIGEIMEYGESDYFEIVYLLCGIPSDYKSFLLDYFNIDYMLFSDFNFFILMTRNMTPDQTSILFGENLDLSRMKVVDTDPLYLEDPETGIVIDDFLYSRMIGYIRQMHGIVPKVERAANAETKEVLLMEDRMKRQKKQPYSSVLLPLVSGLVNNADFKYDIQGLRNIGIYAFFDSVNRINALNTSRAVLNGMYSGMVDMSKNPGLKKQIDWLRDLSSEKVASKSNVTVTSS